LCCTLCLASMTANGAFAPGVRSAAHLLRSDMGNMLEYHPVQPLEVLAAEIGIPVEALCKLDANENLYGAHSSVVEAGEAALRSSHIYPDPGQGELRAALGRYCSVSPEQVVAGAGADDILDLLFRVVCPKKVVTCPPTFAMYKFFGKISRSEIVDVPLKKLDRCFAFDMDGILREGASSQIVFLTSPNNPTGTRLSNDDVERICTALPNCMIVVDEAYIEFAAGFPHGTASVLLDKHVNLVVVRTFAKWAGLAGMRVGYALAHPDIIKAICQIKIPYNLSVAASATGVAALAAPTGPILQKIRRERARLLAVFNGPLSEWFEPYPSEANFVLVRLKPVLGRTSRQLTQGLRKMGILIRCYDELLGMTDCIRISVGRPQDTDQLLRGLLVQVGALSPVVAAGSLPAVPSTAPIALPAVTAAGCVLWDVDGVIVDVGKSYRQTILDTCASFGAEVTGQEVEAVKRRGNANNDWIVTRTLVAEKNGSAPSLEEVTSKFEQIYKTLRDTEELVPAQSLLSHLSQQVPQGIITGRPRSDADYVLSKMEIASYFPVVKCMEDGPAKPSPKLLLDALDELKVPHSTVAVFLGDTVDDIKAALACKPRPVIPVGVVPPGKDGAAAADHEAHLYEAGAWRVVRNAQEMQDLLAPKLQAAPPGQRLGSCARETKETKIKCDVVVEGSGVAKVSTKIGFLDHMLETLTKHSRTDLNLIVDGDIHVDDHHTTEDAALALGTALDQALGNRAGVTRFGSAFAPLDEALACAVVDLSGRPSASVSFHQPLREQIGGLSGEMVSHFFVSIATTLRATVHVDVTKGVNSHHMVEAAFKAFAMALRAAMAKSQFTDIPSAKGVL